MTERIQPISTEDLAILNLIRGEAGGEPYMKQTATTDHAVSFALVGRIDPEFVSRVRRIRELDAQTHKLKRTVECDNHCGPIEEIPCVECNWVYRRPMRFSVEGELWRLEQEKVAGEKTTRAQQALRRIESGEDDPDQ